MIYYPLPDDFESETERATRSLNTLFESSYSRALKAAKAVVDSYNVPVGTTPREKVWALNKTVLYHYVPKRPRAERHPVPLLLVYALINKPFIFDLAPGRSFIEFLLEQGFEVYLLDWGTPGPEDRGTRFDDYVTQYLSRAVRKLLHVSEAGAFSMLGYCLGATLALVYAAHYPDVPLRNLVLVTAPIDFCGESQGSMAMWLEEERFDVDKAVDTLGNIPGELIEMWAKMLKPAENFVGIYVTLWKQLEDEAGVRGWQAINRWVEDVVPFAGEAFRQFVKDYLRANKLARGEHLIDGRPVQLSNVRASLLNVVAKYDHLVSQAQSESVIERVASPDKEMKIVPSTHVGIMASARAKEKLWPEIVDWLAPRSGEKPDLQE
jgi:polyhydroxyalkanoate synthase